MKRKVIFLIIALGLIVLSACNKDDDTTEKDTADDELYELKVEFEVPETVAVDETVPMNAIVTYGDEKVKDADDVEFEFWEKGNEDDSTKLEAKNNKDGTYTAETAFDHDGEFEMYAHVTARDLHTMPKKSVMVGEGASETDHPEGDKGEHAHTDGFGMNFTDPENAKVKKDTVLTVDLQMADEPFEKADVRFEIWNDAISEKHEWVDAKESTPGQYTAKHAFTEAGTYNMMIHVTDDDGLHEHEEHEVEVTK